MNWCKICNRTAKYVLVCASFSHQLEYVCGYHKKRSHTCLQMVDDILKQYYAPVIRKIVSAPSHILFKPSKKFKFGGYKIKFPIRRINENRA